MSPRVALSLGDPNGVGPEIVIKALAELAPEERERLVVYGPDEVLRTTAQALGLAHLLKGLAQVHVGGLPTGAHQPGRIDAEAGRSAVASASAAIEACRAGEVQAVVAGPHHETAIAQAGIRFSGYPSLVASVCGQSEDEVFLLLIGGGLRIVHATLHESVERALSRLNPALVVAATQAGIRFSGYPSLVASVCGQSEDEVFLMLIGGGLRIVHATLHESVERALSRLNPALVVAATQAGVRACRRLGVAEPRVALFGLNPHASEGELFGPHDARCTVPAARTLREQGLDMGEPQGADVLLADHARRPHDLYVAMFHDQGHIPIKLLAPQGASALSIGADVLLASTGHGSAMDIAGTGQARPDALLRSLRLVLGQTPASTSAPTSA